MAIRDIFKISRKTFFNPSSWIDANWLAFQNKTIWDILSGLFIVAGPVREETFEQAMVRLDMTEEDVQHAVSYYRIYAVFFLFVALIVLIYSFYLLIHHTTWHGWLLGLAATAIFVAQAFKYDFWAFQMKQRKLGLTFQDWKNNLFGS